VIHDNQAAASILTALLGLLFGYFAEGVVLRLPPEQN
jgi:hypothetical protein